jgi:IS5 family transposase
VRDRRRTVAKRIRALSAQRGRGRDSLPAIDRLTGEIAQRAKQTVREARRLSVELARRRGQRRRAVAPLVVRLERELQAAEQVLAQTDLRLRGQRSIPDRRVSLVDTDARPIHTGAPGGRAIRFGYKARVADTAEGFVIADVPERGGPTDGSLLDGAIDKAKRAGMQLRSVYGDRGFGTSTADAALARQGIRDAVIPRQQRAGPREHSRSWRRRYRFRNGLEGRISQLKRKGLRRTRLRSLEGAQTWVAGITLAHNLQRLALLG